MTRQPRVDLPGLPQHVIQRGCNRANIFACADDYQYFRRVLTEAMRQYGVALHAYVLMGNHVHLLATPGETGAVGRMMQTIECRYVRYFNRRYGRSGTLWENRYHATVVEIDSYLLACHRYIELNPVRAGLVAEPAEYRWSSHCGNIGQLDDELLTAHPWLATFGATPTERRRAYLRLFDEALDAQTVRALRDRTNNGWALGREGFERQLLALGASGPGPLQGGGKRRGAVQ